MFFNTQIVKKKTIGIYIPRWLYQFDGGITLFVKDLYRTVQASENYRLKLLAPSKYHFTSAVDAEKFRDDNNLVLIHHHGPRFLSRENQYEKNVRLLESCVPFLTGTDVHVAADDKLAAKRTLRTKGIPVLDDAVVRTATELKNEMKERELYVAKPHDSGSGRGVKLIKREGEHIYEYMDRRWHLVRVIDSPRGVVFRCTFSLASFALVGLVALSVTILIFMHVPRELLWALAGLCGVLLVRHFIKKLDQIFTYSPLMLEPFFGDGMEEFYCLRCTVIGNEVVEAAKKANRKNVTPNISHGGKATQFTLSEDQRVMAIRAAQAVGAEFAGVDLLVRGTETVVCEINIGPLGVYCKDTGIRVGKILGEYLIQKADHLTSS